MVFNPRIFTLTIGHDVGLDVFILSFPAQILIKFSVLRSSGITHFRRPHLLGRFMISPKSSHARLSKNRGIATIAGTRTSIKNTMTIGEEVAQARIGQHSFYTFVVGTFWQPNPLSRSTESLFIVFTSHLDLRPHCLGVHLH